MSHEAFHGFIELIKSERMFKKFSVSILLIMGPVSVQHINKTVAIFHVYTPMTCYSTSAETNQCKPMLLLFKKNVAS